MITEFKIFELINNKELVTTTINKTLLKIQKNNRESIYLKKRKDDKLVLHIEFDVIENHKKQVDIEIEKLKKQLEKSGTYLSYSSKIRHKMKMIDDDSVGELGLDFEVDKDNPGYEHYHVYVKDTHFYRIKPPRYLYHMTRHKNYRSIVENGLEIRENEIYSDTPQFNHPKAIYASSERDFFGYTNDDEWRIDTSKIDNKWWRDYNIYDEEIQNKSFLTYEPIPFELGYLLSK